VACIYTIAIFTQYMLFLLVLLLLLFLIFFPGSCWGNRVCGCRYRSCSHWKWVMEHDSLGGVFLTLLCLCVRICR